MQLETALINADKAGDVEAAKQLANALKSESYTVGDSSQGAESSKGFVDQVSDFFTGDDRATEQTDSLPEIQDSGLLSDDNITWDSKEHLKAQALGPALLTATDPNEITKIITSNYPHVGVTYNKDAAGGVYPVLRNNKTGAVAQINKPGFSAIDAIQGLGMALAFTPAGRASSFTTGVAGKTAAGALASGATSAAIEGAQALSGGDFNAENVAIDTALGGAFDAVPSAINAYKNKTEGALDIATQAAEQAEAIRIGSDLSPEAIATRQAQGLEGLANAAQATGKKQEASMRNFSEEVLPDERVLKAAREIGVDDKLLPSAYSKNNAYIELEQGVASIPGSKLSTQSKEAVVAVAQKADDLITEFGGSIDKSGLSENLKTRMLSSIDELDTQAEDLYLVIKNEIPRTHRVDITNVTDEILEEANQLGGQKHLEGFEKQILDIASQEGGPTYHLLDKERKRIGRALSKAQGPYKDEDAGALNRMYSLLTGVQEKAAGEFGMADTWNAAKALVSERKTIEENSIKLLGKDKANAIMPKVGKAVKNLSTGDFKAFDQVMNAIPKAERQGVVISALNDAFTMGSRKEKQLSAPGFVDWMEGLNRNTRARSRIYKHMKPEARKRLNNLFRVAKGMRDANAEKINTGRIVALLDNFGEAEGMVSKVYQTGRKVAAAEAIGSSVGLPGAGTAGVIAETLSRRNKDPLTKAADDMISSQIFQRAAKSTANSNVATRAANERLRKMLNKSEAAKKWAELLPHEIYREVARIGVMGFLNNEE